MANGVNKVILVGNLGADPELRYSNTGTAFASASLATTRTWKDNNGERQDQTEWHRLSLFGRTAEVLSQHARKGSKIYIEGRLQTRKWQDKDGKDQYITEIVANEMQLLDRISDGNARQSPPATQTTQPRSRTAQTQQRQAGPPEPPPYDDDIPF